jgi:hypothetical protein
LTFYVGLHENGGNTMKSQVAKTEIGRADWDFSSCPDDEKSFCFAYEYFREVALAHRKRTGADWSSIFFAEAFRGYFRDGKRHDLPAPEQGNLTPYEINLAPIQTYGVAASNCPGFPEEPYLKVISEYRKKLIKEFDLERWRPNLPTMAQESFVHIFINRKDALERYKNHASAYLRQRLEKNSAAPSDRWIVDHDGFKFELGVIRLNWSTSDKQMIEGFKNWLKSNRPKDIKPHETRGSAQMSECLKYLSAFRLLAVMTAKEAADYTQDILGDPLYTTEDNWYVARVKARQLIVKISSPFFDWAENYDFH